MKNNIGVSILAIAVLVMAVAGFVKEPTQFGAFPGPDITNRVEFKSGMAEGGMYTVATSSSTFTLADRDIANSKVISIASVSDAAALALTLPAASAWPSLTEPGTSQSWIIDNLHTEAATTTTITAGVGVDIDGTTANDEVINGGVSGRLECWRLTDGNVRCIVEEMVDAG